MPAVFDLHQYAPRPERDGSGVKEILISGRITDPEIPGESEHAEFTINKNLLATFPAGEAARTKAINEWLEEKVNERHYLWMQRRETEDLPFQPVPLEEVAAVIGDPDDPHPRLHIKKTHRDAGTKPKGLDRPAEAAAPLSEFDALGRRRKSAEEKTGGAKKG